MTIPKKPTTPKNNQDVQVIDGYRKLTTKPTFLALLLCLLLVASCNFGSQTTEAPSTEDQADSQSAAPTPETNSAEEPTEEPADEPTEEPADERAEVESDEGESDEGESDEGESDEGESDEGESGESAASTNQEEEANQETEAAQEEEAIPITFQLVTDGTEARFIVDEILMGNDKTVIGVTSDVTGEIVVAPADPEASEIGTITINARDFKTDSSRRNRAIQRQVLLTANNDYQFITFTPTAIENLPEEIQVGDTINFTVIGDLKILDVTRSESFDMSLTVHSEQELIGLASTTVLYADFGISIPRVPIVASVEDEVRLELEFRAIAN